MLIGDPRRVKILVADSNLKLLGPPLVGWDKLDCTRKLNEVGTGSFTVPATDTYVAQLTTPGNRIHVMLDDKEWISGPIEQPGAYSWSVGGDDSGPGNISIGFADNLAYLTWRLIYPNPAAAATAQGTTKQYQSTGVNNNTEIRNLVNKNAGPGALTARQIPHLVLGTAATGIGGNVTVTARFDALTDILRDIASQQGSLVFDVLMNASNQLEFNVRAPVDRSGKVVFSRSRNNLSSLTTDPQAPTANAAIVFPDVDNTDQTITERTNSASITAWGRVEKGVSRTDLDGTPTTAQKTAQWQQDGDLALLDGHESVNITATVVDTADQQYGVHYLMGDTVTVELVQGTYTTDVVSQVQLTASPSDGVRVVPTIGNGNDKVGDPIIALVRDITRRVGRLESG